MYAPRSRRAGIVMGVMGAPLTDTHEFSLYARRTAAPRQWRVPAIVAAAVYALLAVSLLLMPERLLPVPLQPRLDVTFVQKVVKPEPPPPALAQEVQPAASSGPAAPTPVPQAIPAAAAPLVRPEQKVRKLDKPPPLKKVEAPREIPREVPKEVEPSADKGVAVVEERTGGDAAGLEGGVSRGVAGGAIGGAIELPGDAVAPKLAAGNAAPEYPAEARAARKSGVVVLKVIVYADGSVGDVRAIEGEEPFVSAALHAVKSWRYEPARYKGQPIAVYRTIRIPFRLSS